MALKYFVNEKTGKWHIVGFCCHSKNPSADKKMFDSEEELYDYFGRKTIPCLLCQVEKEKRLKKG